MVHRSLLLNVGASMSFDLSAQHFVNWCAGDVLPLWAKRGVDRMRGGFFEQLHFDGTPDEGATRRIRVSARQIYAFSHASMLGWMDGRELVNWGVDYLINSVQKRDGEPGFAHLLDSDGNICDHRRDLYDHAFHILAFSWASRATGDSQMLGKAIETLAFVDEAMGAKRGGWYEGLPTNLPRRQNPHMHMLEALLALYEASNDPDYLQRADRVIALLQERFIDPKSGLLFEFFNEEWTPITPAVIEPGHMAEWCWLLHYRSSFEDTKPAPLALQLGTLADGYAEQGGGFLLDAFDANGKATKLTRRLWGQTEWLKSMLVRSGAHSGAMQNMAGAHLQRINKSYLNTEVSGLWIDQFDQDGQKISKHVPASIVYHLVSAAAETERAMTTIKDVGG